MSNDSYDFLAGGAPSARFENVGDTFGGRIVEEPEQSQQTDYKSGELLWWDKEKTQPRMQLIVTVQTDLRDPEISEDDGKRRIFVKGKSMTNAVRGAVKAAGSKGLDIGGELHVTYIGLGEAKPRMEPPKLYRAQYAKPNASASFLANDEPAPAKVAETVAPAPAPTPAPAAGDPLAGLTPEQRAALAALGIAQ